MSTNHLKTCFRQSMQRMAFPTVILTSSSSVGTSPEDYHGLTISSITSLSVNPSPLLQFNVQIPSLSSKNLRSFDTFAVHLLKPEPISVNLVNKFSQGIGKGGTKPFSDLIEGVDFDVYKNNNFDKSNSVLPVLKNVERILICKKHDVFPVADHEIWVGEVIDGIVVDNAITGGLLHSNRKFSKLGSEIAIKTNS